MVNAKEMMMVSFLDVRLKQIWEKITAGKRLKAKDGLVIYESQDLIGIGHLADYVRRKRHGNTAFYVYNQHVNYTNVCTNRCLFCAFARDENTKGAFTLSIDDVREQLLERMGEPITEIHMVGGLNPNLSINYYVDLLNTIKKIRPDVTIKAFTAVEIDFIAKKGNLSITETIETLKDAGLSMMPGGGAEIINERVRSSLFPGKINGSRWLEITKTAHDLGITSNATMLYGHIETSKERVDHLITLRDLQDKTSGFSAFIPLAFHPENTKLTHISSTTAVDDLKNIAAARLLLDNFDHIKAYWVMIGEKLAQVALSFGADDLDGTIIEEKITHMAGAKTAKGLLPEQMEHLISSAGFTPVERDSFYRPVAR
jgi:aminodeoxyfutalosine synthase